MRFLKSTMTTFLALLCLGIPSISRAQWTAGNYEVDAVLESGGNFVYSADSSAGYVSAIAPASGGSNIKVRFKRTYSAPEGTPSKNITPKGRLTGSVTVSYSASSRVEQGSQWAARGVNGPGSYDFTESLPAVAVSAPQTTVTIIGKATAAPHSREAARLRIAVSISTGSPVSVVGAARRPAVFVLARAVPPRRGKER
jgi:hypothetical protein